MMMSSQVEEVEGRGSNKNETRGAGEVGSGVERGALERGQLGRGRRSD